MLSKQVYVMQMCVTPLVSFGAITLRVCRDAGGGALFAAFSAPFWVAGVQLGKQAFGGAFQSERLELGWAKAPGIRKRWRLAARLPSIRGGSVDWNGQSAVILSHLQFFNSSHHPLSWDP